MDGTPKSMAWMDCTQCRRATKTGSIRTATTSVRQYLRPVEMIWFWVFCLEAEFTAGESVWGLNECGDRCLTALSESGAKGLKSGRLGKVSLGLCSTEVIYVRKTLVSDEELALATPSCLVQPWGWVFVENRHTMACHKYRPHLLLLLINMPYTNARKNKLWFNLKKKETIATMNNFP